MGNHQSAENPSGSRGPGVEPQTVQTSSVMPVHPNIGESLKGKHITIASTERYHSEPAFGLEAITRPCFDCPLTFWQPIRRLSELAMAGNRVPINYHTPSFPSLYDPMPYDHKQAYYLYYTTDIWRFTLYWTLLFYGTFHLTVASCAVLTHCRNWSVIWLVPLVYVVVASLQALMAGSIVGLV